MDKCAMRRRISAVDFAIWETELYLDTHPDCQNALAKRAELLAERAELIAAYEARFGVYAVTSSQVPTANRWAWVDDPWPWDLEGGAC